MIPSTVFWSAEKDEHRGQDWKERITGHSWVCVHVWSPNQYEVAAQAQRGSRSRTSTQSCLSDWTLAFRMVSPAPLIFYEIYLILSPCASGMQEKMSISHLGLMLFDWRKRTLNNDKQLLFNVDSQAGALPLRPSLTFTSPPELNKDIWAVRACRPAWARGFELIPYKFSGHLCGRIIIFPGEMCLRSQLKFTMTFERERQV